MSASGICTPGGAQTIYRIGHGAMQRTGKVFGGLPRDHDEAIRVLRRAVESDVNLIELPTRMVRSSAKN